MQILDGIVRSYPWGSRTAIAELRGRPAPTESPEAELWFGAHPGGPSLVAGVPLTEIIAADPEYHLGARVRREFGDTVPFLLKILAAAEPLSLQAHPSREQAQEGFARENAEGVELSAGHRNYKDDNHKPEIIVALTDFDAMTGFRPLAQTLELVAALDCSELDRYTAMLDVENEDSSLRALFTTWITIPLNARTELIDALVSAAEDFLQRPGYPEWMVDTVRNLVLLHKRYPQDAGILGAFLLNKVSLKPGQAIYLDAGELHAYVHGLGVELMANSDNVLRGGLTTKHVDVPELVRVLHFAPLDNPAIPDSAVQRSAADGVEWAQYPVPINEFALARCVFTTVGAATTISGDGPRIALCTAGEVALSDAETSATLRPGMAVWIPAGNPEVTAAAEAADSQLFVASV